MSTETFYEYSKSANLTEDQTYTVELLSENARVHLEEDYWNKGWQARDDARKASDYHPKISPDWALKAGPWLAKAEWISLQRIGDSQRPVRSLEALRYLPSLTGLILQGNAVQDVTSLQACKSLRRLDLSRNNIRDISALATCAELKELNLNDNPLEDMAVLEGLPQLEILEISSDQLPRFTKLKKLAKLRKLQIDGDSFNSFRGFPEMPGLRIIWGANVDDLAGLERFVSVENLVNISGKFVSLAPLAGLKRLTHANLDGGNVADLSPLSKLSELRDLWLGTKAESVDFSPLVDLPNLRELNVKREGEELPGVDKVCARLTNWDVEFRSATPRHIPSARIEVVTQKEFDRFDVRESFGMLPTDGNEQLLDAEREWLEHQIELVFAPDFKEGEDYDIPFQWAGARSRTIMLQSEKAIEAFPLLVKKIQTVLSHARNDWIIYFQSEGEEFIVWLYADKIVVTPEFEKNVRNLLQSR